jgi:hypothetical protein
VRVFIPTKGRYDTINTHKVFDGTDYMIVVHNVDEADRYLENDSIPLDRLVVSGVAADAYGLTRQREWIVDNLVDEDEWFIFADDNIRYIEAVPEEWYGNDEQPFGKLYSAEWRKRYATHCSMDRFMDIAYEMVDMAEGLDTVLCGFAAVDNYYYRRGHWRTYGYVIGKMTIVCNHNIARFYRHDITMEDFTFTAYTLLKYGRVLINNYVRAVAGHYQAGGMGKYDERIPYRLADCVKLMDLFPGLYRPKKLKHMVPGTDLALRLTGGEHRIDAWRETMRRPVVRCEKEKI